jgi:ParB family chromosome partitioning protein
MEDLSVQGPVFLIEVDKISPNPLQPRRDFNEESLKELAASIREFGILQPLVVSKIEKEAETGTQVAYQLIAGERRWRAAQLLGLERVPAIIRNISLERERLEMAVIENVQRANLNAIEAARAYARLQDEFNLTQREIASRLGKSRETIANTVRLLQLPTQIQEAIAQNQISESQGRLLLSVADLAHQQTLFEDLLKNNLSVRELKTRIQRAKTPSLMPVEILPEVSADPETALLQKELEEALGAKVKVERAGETGKLIISFYSPEELRGLVQKLKGETTASENPPL